MIKVIQNMFSFKKENTKKQETSTKVRAAYSMIVKNAVTSLDKHENWVEVVKKKFSTLMIWT